MLTKYLWKSYICECTGDGCHKYRTDYYLMILCIIGSIFALIIDILISPIEIIAIIIDKIIKRKVDKQWKIYKN